ncbi:MAG TPA: hypothetical protein VNO24_21315 [Blastocatellia bacterium]|nr:hypothetical protein [Blastocatellia bacterium]
MKNYKARATQVLPWPVVTGDTADHQPYTKIAPMSRIQARKGATNSGT